MEHFLDRLKHWPSGYTTGLYQGKRWGMTLERRGRGRQIKLFARELGGADHVSFNLYLPSSGKVLLKPCEMPKDKVIRFVLGVEML